MREKGPSIEVRNLTHGFGKREPIFRDLSFAIAPASNGSGQIVALMGPSGVGKSTILQLIGQYATGDKHEVSAGIILRDADVISYVPQEAVLIESRDFSYNIDLFQHIGALKAHWSADKRERFIELLKIEGLRDRKEMGSLSGGEKQRVMLARTLALNPDIILLDEPVSSLDQSVKVPLLIELRDLIVNNGILALYITHDFNEARLIADKVLYLETGPGSKSVHGTVTVWDFAKFAKSPPTINAAYTVFYPYFGVVGDVAASSRGSEKGCLAMDGSALEIGARGMAVLVKNVSSSTVLLCPVGADAGQQFPAKRDLFGTSIAAGDVVHIKLDMGMLRYDENGQLLSS